MDGHNGKLDAYPIGSLYWSSNPTNPGYLFGGVWTQIKDTFIYAADDNDDVGKYTAQQGAATNTHRHRVCVGANGNNVFVNDEFEQIVVYGPYRPLTAGSISGYHNVSYSSNETINIMPPYLKRYCWERTA